MVPSRSALSITTRGRSLPESASRPRTLALVMKNVRARVESVATHTVAMRSTLKLSRNYPVSLVKVVGIYFLVSPVALM